MELSILCFRYVPGPNWSDEELDLLQYKMLAELEKSGKAFLTPTILNGRVALQICFANHRTTSEDADILFELLTTIGEEIVKKNKKT